MLDAGTIYTAELVGFSIADDSSSHTPYRKMKQIQTGH
jgi:hypothetical protein